MAKAKEDTRAAPTAPMPREEQDKVTAVLRQNLDNQRERAGVVPPGHDATPAQAKSETPQSQQPPLTTRVTRQSASQSSSSAEPQSQAQSQAQRGFGHDASPQPQPYGQPTYPQGSTSFSPSDSVPFGIPVGTPFAFPQTGTGTGTGTGASPDMFSEFLNIPGLSGAAASSVSPATTEMLANLHAYAGGASELGLPGMWQPPPQGSTPNSDSQSNNLLETQACQLISLWVPLSSQEDFESMG